MQNNLRKHLTLPRKSAAAFGGPKGNIFISRMLTDGCTNSGSDVAFPLDYLSLAGTSRQTCANPFRTPDRKYDRARWAYLFRSSCHSFPSILDRLLQGHRKGMLLLDGPGQTMVEAPFKSFAGSGRRVCHRRFYYTPDFKKGPIGRNTLRSCQKAQPTTVYFGSTPSLPRSPLFHKGTDRFLAARLLMSVLLRWLPEDRRADLLLDAWYMKAPLLLPLIQKGVTTIGQIRRDTALFLEPLPSKEQKPGRPRKYGQRITRDNIRTFCPLQHRKIFAYGRERRFQFYESIAMARLLKGHSCRIVWCRFQQDDTKWSKWHLLLSTNQAINGCDLIEKYARRWWTESMFNEIKNIFGLKSAWEQTRQTLARWTMILNLAYSLPRLLALQLGPEVVQKLFPIPWRQNRPATAGWVTLFIARFFAIQTFGLYGTESTENSSPL